MELTCTIYNFASAQNDTPFPCEIFITTFIIIEILLFYVDVQSKKGLEPKGLCIINPVFWAISYM